MSKQIKIVRFNCLSVNIIKQRISSYDFNLKVNNCAEVLN